MRRTLLLLSTLLLAACPVNVDKNNVSVDGDVDNGHLDGGVSVDGTVAEATPMPVHWFLISASLSGGNNNGYKVACDDSIGDLEFTVTDVGGVRVSTRACPAGATEGIVQVAVPPGNPPYTVSAIATKRPMSRSWRAMPTHADETAIINIFVEGCDLDQCL